jgi:nucleoid DNA-binding protein
MTLFHHARPARENSMADARRMGKMELFAHFADKFDMKRTAVRDLFDELNRLSEKELKRSGEFVLPGMCKLVVQKRKAREGRIRPLASRSRFPPRRSSRRELRSS